MYALLFVQKIPGKLISFLLTYLFPVGIFFRFLIHSFTGTLVLVLMLYWLLSEFGESKPLTFYQLIIWVDELDSTVKTSVLTSVLTVIGFLVAFRTGTESWKVQTLGQIKLRLADELDKFFSEATSLATDLRLIAQSSLNSEQLVRAGITNELLFGIDRAVEKLPEFRAKRLRLQAMAVESYRIAGSNFSLLATVPGTVEWLDQSISALNDITKKIWITIPEGLPAEKVHRVDLFSRLINRPEYESFIVACEQKVTVISGSIGGIRGALLAPVLQPNLSSYLALFKKRRLINEAFATFVKSKSEKDLP